MRIKKEYGSYKTDICPYCGGSALGKNKLGLPVCKTHKDTDDYPDLKCVCGDWIDLKQGKYGLFGLCLKCGPQNLQKILAVQPEAPAKQEVKKNKTYRPKIDPTAYPLILD